MSSVDHFLMIWFSVICLEYRTIIEPTIELAMNPWVVESLPILLADFAGGLCGKQGPLLKPLK